MREKLGKTLVEDVYSQLRDEILNGSLPPGTRLKINELTAKRGVSSSVLREALAQLAQRDLVTVRPQAGYSVVELSAATLADLSQARRHVEGAAIRDAVAVGGLDWSARVVAAHHVLAHTPLTSPDEPRHPSPEWISAHLEFHRTLLSAGPSRTLTGIAGTLLESYEIYRQWVPDFGVAYEQQAMAEHDALALAVQRADADRAAELLDQHIARNTELLLRYTPRSAAAPSAS